MAIVDDQQGVRRVSATIEVLYIGASHSARYVLENANVVGKLMFDQFDLCSSWDCDVAALPPSTLEECFVSLGLV